MRKSLFRSSSLVIIGSVVFAATACGSDDDRKTEGKPAASSATTTSPVTAPSPAAGAPSAGAPSAPVASGAPAGTPLTAAQLEKAVLTATELPQGTYLTREPKGAGERVTAAAPDCQPVTDLLLPRQGAVKPVAAAQAAVTIGAPMPSTVITTELFSFAATDAETIVGKARGALAKCGSLTTKDAEGETSTVRHAEAAHPKLGDETLAIHSTPEDGGSGGQVVVRVGGTLVVVRIVEFTGTTPKLPDTATVTRQVEKVVAAAKG
ncbi:hypothetical protein ACFRCG_05655 [Embleya sp. NPDC056575]|uniref:hypothetical protein n=1 Tax=unclassified Embleya TaxID=2699296 RepID=UPI0036BA1BD6